MQMSVKESITWELPCPQKRPLSNHHNLKRIFYSHDCSACVAPMALALGFGPPGQVFPQPPCGCSRRPNLHHRKGRDRHA